MPVSATRLAEHRDARFHTPPGPPVLDPEDRRTPGQRDRDRIQYTSAFRRLDGITQVVAPTEGHVFHNRLTHTLEVAQIGRRLAEKLLREQHADDIAAAGGLDPDVVEAAALAHDLGHPPFGHVAEETLCAWLDRTGSFQDGFEGNAQSFRIVTRLAVRRDDVPGLDLTRATLNAVLKYPWGRATSGKHRRKWGAYHTEEEYLTWARRVIDAPDVVLSAEIRSVEAELMDWADDVAYSVHDVEDFYRAGLIPIDRITRKQSAERDRFLHNAFERRHREGTVLPYPEDDLSRVFTEVMLGLFPQTELYVGTREQRAALRRSTSKMISRYIGAVTFAPPTTARPRWIAIDPELGMEVAMLKELTWYYVVNNPTLATQRHGQRRVIESLLEMFMAAAASRKDWVLFPEGYREQLELRARDASGSSDEQTRVVIDLVASMTEQQAIRTYHKLTGVSLGSVLDPLGL